MADPDKNVPDSADGNSPEECPTSRETWEQLPTDPDLHEDLGYEMLELEVYHTGDESVIFLPEDEDMLREAAFIVAEEDAVGFSDE